MSLSSRAFYAFLALVVTVTGVSYLVPLAAQATTGATFTCTGSTVYLLDKNGDLRSVSGTTGSTSYIKDFDSSSNQLGITNQGALAILVEGSKIVRYNPVTAKVDRLDAKLPAGAGTVAGAVNPTNNRYYYGGYKDGKLLLSVYDPIAHTTSGPVASITLPWGTEGGNGDLAFDAQGRLYAVASTTSKAHLLRVDGALPTGGSNAVSLTATRILETKVDDAVNGIAFGADGFLYLSTSSTTMFRADPSSGVPTPLTVKGLGDWNYPVDLASCATPSTAAAQVKLPSGRYAGSDQFQVAITGGGIGTGNTGTTTGTDTGVQDEPAEMAGPLTVSQGTAYTVTQTAAGGANLANYRTTWSCVREADGTVVASGNGSAGTFTMPTTSGVNVLCTFTNTPIVPSVEIDQTVSAVEDLDGNGPDAGDRVTYAWKVTNTGATALSGVAVTDAVIGAVACDKTALAVGESMTCTPQTYTLTQGDVDAGKRDNSATVRGTSPTGTQVTDDDSVSTVIPATPRIDIDLTQSAIADLDGNGPDAGDEVTYGYLVTNTGNVPLASVAVTDTRGAVVCQKTALAVGEAMTCTQKTYQLKQADVTAGGIANTATATGKRGTTTVTDTDTEATTVPVSPSVLLDLRAGPVQDVDGNGPDAGDTITYTHVVTNTGNVPLTNVTVTDDRVGTVTCAGTLEPGAAATCTPKTYVLTQADVDKGTVRDSAKVTGKAPSGTVVQSTDDVTTPVAAVPAIGLDLVASAIDDADRNGPDAGDVVTYTYTVTNTGAQALTAVTVTDAFGAVTCPAGTLAPGASVACTAKSHPLTQGEVDAGRLDNAATATGTSPTGTTVTDDDTTRTPVPANPVIDLVLTAGPVTDLDDNGVDVGDTIAYEHVVTNAGNVTLTAVTIPGATCPTAPLAPGAQVTCSSTPRVLKQGDIDAGSVVRDVTVSGTDPRGTVVKDPATVTTVIGATPAIEVDLDAGAVTDLDGNGVDAGDTITYTYRVTNTGNVSLDPVRLTDERKGAITCPAGVLAPAASVTCTSTAYSLTQADLDRGSVANTATVRGTSPAQVEVTDDDDVSTPLPARPALTLDKGAGAIKDVDGDGIGAGDTVTYTFTVANTGNVTLSRLTIADPLTGPVTCPTTPLAPGATVSCEPRTYTLTQADVNAGGVENFARATGTAPDGTDTTGEDTHAVTIGKRPAVSLEIVPGAIADLDGNGPDAGDTVPYTYEVTNTGNVPLTGIVVADPVVGAVTCPAEPLAPGATLTCGPADHTLTQGDVDRGKVDTTATVTGTAPDGKDVTATDTATVPIAVTAPANLVLAKTVDVADPHVGQVVTYTLTVRNTGARAAEDVVVRDVLPGGVTLVSAAAPCVTSGQAVTCELGSVAAGANRAVTVRAKVDPLPPATAAHQHLLDVQKSEVHVDLEAGQTRTVTTECLPGYLVTDGSGRIDHVDQGTGTLASVGVSESRAVGEGTWQVTLTNDATGRAQGKAFSVCVKADSEEVNGHGHRVVVGEPVARTEALPIGRATVTVDGVPGTTPVRPGFDLDGSGAHVLTSYPAGDSGWTFVVEATRATKGTFGVSPMSRKVSQASGHDHELGLDEVRQTVTVPAGQVLETTLTCANDAKGIVAGWDLDAGLVNLGNDPRPVARVFKLHNPTSAPLAARLRLLCLSVRNKGAVSAGGSVVNTATVATSSAETSTADNSASARIVVNPAPAAAPAAATVAVTAKAATASLRCAASSKKACAGTARLVLASTQRVGGRTYRAGTVLATKTYRVKAGKVGRVALKPTAVGRKVLKAKAVKKARLVTGGSSKVVRLRR